MHLLEGFNQYIQTPLAPALINVQAPTPQVIQAGGQVLAPSIKKYIATPDTFDGQSKHWKMIKDQINTFTQVNSVALTSDENKNRLVMSYLKGGLPWKLPSWLSKTSWPTSTKRLILLSSLA